jgi:hypothetical protein
METQRIITVKVIPEWSLSKDYIPIIWPKLSENNDLRWKNIQVVTDEKADYYVLLNASNGKEYYDPSKTIILQMEGGIKTNKYWNWGEFSNPDRNKFLRVMDCESFRSNVEWWVSKSYKELQKDISKNPYVSNVLTSVMSKNYFSEGHKQRVDFLNFLQDNADFPVHIYGGGWKCGLPAFKSHFMDDGILPYKYWFHAERCDEPGYFCGGKLITGLVCECLTFYWGCSDIEKWIDPRSFIRLDLNDHQKSMKIIKEAIENNEWEKRLPYIREMKHKILNELQAFPTIHSIISEIENSKNSKDESN